MIHEILTFDSFDGLLRYIDRDIEEAERKLAIYIDMLSEMRDKAEKLRILQKAIAKIIGGEMGAAREVDLMGLKVVVGARPIDLVDPLEKVIGSLEGRLEVLSKIRKVLEPIARSMEEVGGISIIVELTNQVPTRIFVREEVR